MNAERKKSNIVKLKNNIMKPIEREGYIDIWILIQQNTNANFTLNLAHSSELGVGFHSSLKSAQHAQTMELLKGNKTEVFHLEWPIK